MESESTEGKTETVTSETQTVADVEETAPHPNMKTDSPSKRKGESCCLPVKMEAPPMKYMKFSMRRMKQEVVSNSFSQRAT